MGGEKLHWNTLFALLRTIFLEGGNVADLVMDHLFLHVTYGKIQCLNVRGINIKAVTFPNIQ